MKDKDGYEIHNLEGIELPNPTRYVLIERDNTKEIIRIYRGNKLLGVELIPNLSISKDRLKVIKQSKYKRYTKYILGRRIIVRRGFDEASIKGKNKFKMVRIYGK